MSELDDQPDPTQEDDEAQELLAGAGDDAGGDDGQEPFDESRARKKIDKANREAANLRKRLKELEPLATKAKELEDASKSESEKLTEKLTAAEKRALDAEGMSLRLEVALDAAPDGTSPKQVLKLAKRLSGATREELETDAEELFADFTPSGDSKPPSKKPTESLKGGGDPEQDPEPDADAVIDAVLKRRRGF